MDIKAIFSASSARGKAIFIASGVGLILALVSAIIASRQPTALAPAFNPAANPYPKGIYANGIIEGVQAQGANINIYPEVAGTITRVFVTEGARVQQGDLLVTLDDSVQRAAAEQQQSQAEAALATLEELRAQPRRETLAVAEAQVKNAAATLKNAQDQLAKQEQSFSLEPHSVSRDALDNARNAAKIAATNLDVVQNQYRLVKAGAWAYDIRNQERLFTALSKAYASSAALLAKYSIRAPVSGIVRTIEAAAGSYVSSQGVYDSYTEGLTPLIIMSGPDDQLQVRVYIDEILIHRLANPEKLTAEMFVRGTDVHLPLEFTRIQPYVTPKIELSDARQERVDLRVLPVIFRFKAPPGLTLYPGQLVDVYVNGR
jgi:HlyD family secretion protein